jgi:conjugative transfer signal peptidase TraF
MTRFSCVMATCLAVAGLGLAPHFHPMPRLIWNASASVPLGLYAVHPAGALRRGELLVVEPPKPLAAYLAARRYLPTGIPLLKHVAALPGQTVCRINHIITVDGHVVGVALDKDYHGRPLPVWQGCLTIAAGAVFLMNQQAAASFDGRYFGSLPASTIVGHAEPLWIKGTR